jgi:hypothetical protein
MIISIHTLQDVLVALVTTVGIAAIVSMAFIAAGAVFKRDQARMAEAGRPVAAPAQHPTQINEARELALR